MHGNSRIIPGLSLLLLVSCGGGGGKSARPTGDAGAATTPDVASTVDVASTFDVTSNADVPVADTPKDVPVQVPCPAGSTALGCNPLAPLPKTLKETGFFPGAPDLKVLGPNMQTFAPSLALWSDGLYKDRQIILPAGKTINVADREVWEFPIGTIVVKTFSADGPNGTRKPIETRVIRRTANPDPFEQYKFDVYQWNDAGTDGTLLTLEARTPVMVTLAGMTHTHQIPSREDCGKCHLTNDTPIIGFDELRLNAPLAAGGARTQLETFAAAGVFSAPLPAPAAKITDADPTLLKVKEYVYGNCVHCHGGSTQELFNMRPEVFVESVVRKMTTGSGTKPGIRVVPGNPMMSVLYLQMARVNLTPGYNPMPPVGVQVADPDALALVRQWITALR